MGIPGDYDPEERAFGTRLLTAYRYAYFVLAAITAAEFAGHDQPIWCFVVIAALPVAFWVMLPPGVDPTDWDRRGRAHLLVAYAGVIALSASRPDGILIMYLLMPLTFTFIEAMTGALLACICLFGVNGAFQARQAHWAPDRVVSLLIEVTVVLGFSFMMARLINWLADRVEERGNLVRELEATRAELADTHHEAGVRVERERMAREIHDTLAQGFTSILMLIQAAGITVDTDAEATRKRLDLAERVARDNLAEARALVAAQGPAEGEGTIEPLADLLGRTVAGLGEELEMAATFKVSGAEHELSSTVQVVLVRVLQESLANIRKHAEAGSVTVELAYRPFATRLTVTDDGRGFDPGPGKGGYGLTGMRARLAQVGGEVELHSTPGRGTTVRVEVPQ
ncbi:sensor histidine kinase [Embleya sp. AB8]|uniref:sensor histidine kinase n=1 Tax=Embleya sp. AB8 TaxID=3156304 RepID=UPI003C74093F